MVYTVQLYQDYFALVTIDSSYTPCKILNKAGIKNRNQGPVSI